MVEIMVGIFGRIVLNLEILDQLEKLVQVDIIEGYVRVEANQNCTAEKSRVFAYGVKIEIF